MRCSAAEFAGKIVLDVPAKPHFERAKKKGYLECSRTTHLHVKHISPIIQAVLKSASPDLLAKIYLQQMSRRCLQCEVAWLLLQQNLDLH